MRSERVLTNPLAEQFETARLLCRRTTVAEAQAILAGETPSGMLFAPGYPTPGAIEVMDLLAGERREDAPGFVSFFMVRKADRAIIGELGGSPAANGEAFTIGYGVTPSVVGQGYTTEAVVGLLALLFEAGYAAAEADTFVDHVASRRVMEKAGMRFVREFEREEDGVPARLVLYRLESRSSAEKD